MSFLYWYLIGLACAAFWPLRYWRGMRGSWCDFLWQWPLHGLAGPFALITAFPV